MTNTPVLNHAWYARLGLTDIALAVEAGERLSMDQGERLFACAEPTAVAALAHFDRFRRHGPAATYVVNQHLNYSNVCVNRCRFCAYRRDADETGAFTFDVDELMAKLAVDAREVHIVGGCHPDLGLGYFEELIATVKDRLPQTCVKAFTAVEIAHFADLESISIQDVLARLKSAGLAMLAGGGAEIFAPRVRAAVCPEKLSGDEWLAIHRTAHELGLRTNCTMLFGFGEAVQDRLDHLDRLRRLQDETGGFVCFIPLPFQAANNPLAGEESPAGPTGVDELTTIGVARLMLDNIPHLKAYWVMLGVLQAQMALLSGADDLDGTVVEEKIGHMAGADSEAALTRHELTTMIQGLGLNPVERDGLFRPVETAS
jgi:aminodeoxyfutalosine synthase